MDKTIIAIDPGKTGACALRWVDGQTNTIKMPDTLGDLWGWITTVPFGSVVYLENVGGYMPGNSGPASVKFSRHMGHLEMALYAAGIPCEKVSPSVWMKALGVPPKMEKMDRKRWIKDLMQRRYPQIKVTLVNADALGLLTFALNKKG